MPEILNLPCMCPAIVWARVTALKAALCKVSELNPAICWLPTASLSLDTSKFVSLPCWFHREIFLVWGLLWGYFGLLQISAERSNHYITYIVQHRFPWSHTWIVGTASGWVTTQSYRVLFVDLACGKNRVFVVKWGSKTIISPPAIWNVQFLLLFAFHSKSRFANMVSGENWLICWVVAKCVSERSSYLIHRESSPYQCRGVCIPFWFCQTQIILMWWNFTMMDLGRAI